MKSPMFWEEFKWEWPVSTVHGIVEWIYFKQLLCFVHKLFKLKSVIKQKSRWRMWAWKWISRRLAQEISPQETSIEDRIVHYKVLRQILRRGRNLRGAFEESTSICLEIIRQSPSYSLDESVKVGHVQFCRRDFIILKASK